MGGKLRVKMPKQRSAHVIILHGGRGITGKNVKTAVDSRNPLRRSQRIEQKEPKESSRRNRAEGTERIEQKEAKRKNRTGSIEQKEPLPWSKPFHEKSVDREILRE